MADYEPPSFSLGLDFLFDSQPQIPVDPIDPKPQRDEEDEEFGPQVADSDPEARSEPPRVLRRLRRGLPPPHETTPFRLVNVEDEIEEFSSQEDVLEELPQSAYYSMCSSSKILLHGCGTIAKSSSEWKKTSENEPASVVTASASTGTSHSEKLFTKLTVSPLRRFQLIDSDSESDNPSTSDKGIITGHNYKFNHSLKNPGVSSTTSEQPRKGSDYTPQREDLWKDFCPIKNFHIPTPALDEMCEEYLHSATNKKAPEKLRSNTFAKSCSDFRETTNGQRTQDHPGEAKPSLPAHRYFLHHDFRIRKLVRDRLPNFFPLGVNDDVRNQQNGAPAIDYMGQFGDKVPSKRRATQQVDLDRSTKRGRNAAKVHGNTTQSSVAKKNSRKRSSKSTGEASQSWVDPKQDKGTQRGSAWKTSKKGQNSRQSSSSRDGLNDSGNWVDPRSSASVANGSAGQWYTGSNGRKVYINKNGQELTGQIAYRQYKKDKGGFSKGKRKGTKKKKN